MLFRSCAGAESSAAANMASIVQTGGGTELVETSGWRKQRDEHVRKGGLGVSFHEQSSIAELSESVSSPPEGDRHRQRDCNREHLVTKCVTQP